MRITRLEMVGESAWPPLEINGLDNSLNVLWAPARGGKSTAAFLAGQLLYGKTPRAWHSLVHGSETKESRPRIEGVLRVTGPQGEVALRRHEDGTPQGRLTASTLNGAPFDRESIQELLCGLAPPLLAKLYAVDFADPPSIGDLLDGDFARHFQAASVPQVQGAHRGAVENLSHRENVGGRRRLASLFERRDAIARELEERLGATRRDSTAAHSESRELERLLVERRRRCDELGVQLQNLERELAEIDQQLRYFSLESTGPRTSHFDDAEHASQLASLDTEIGRCRAMLSELQSREANVRRELAEIHPDGAADGVASLADQRATISVLERLLDDLDAEVSQLAHGAAPNRVVVLDAHARVSPVAQMLRHQVYALCGQVSEQQRAHRRRQLHAEARQLARSQSDLSEQLEHLLERRQESVHAKRIAHRAVMSLPTSPVVPMCQCENHDAFVHNATAMELLHTAPERKLDAMRQRRVALHEQISRARAELHHAEQALALDQKRWESLQRDRREAMDAHAVDALRSELNALERELDLALQQRPSHEEEVHDEQFWKASDTLAKFTDGRLVQVRLRGEGGACAVVDAQGRSRPVEALSPAEHDQVYLALTLALISWHTRQGIHLPLLLDEPFLRQDRAAAAAMAGVLDAFAREGRQVVVFTEDPDVRTRLESLGATIFDLDLLRRQHVPQRPQAPSVAVPAPLPMPSVVVERPAAAVVRVVREPLGEAAPRLRVAGDWTSNEEDPDFFYLEPNAPLSAFPVLGAETTPLFEACQIHSVDQLMAADPMHVAKELGRDGVTPQAVRLWQTHLSLMCFLPGVSLNDAQVLAACGIDSPCDFLDSDVGTLSTLIAEWLASPRGERFRRQADRYSAAHLRVWQNGAQAHRARWQAAAPRYAWTRQPRQVARGSEPPIRMEPVRVPAPRAAKRGRSVENRPSPSRRRDARPSQDDSPREPVANVARRGALRFLLNRQSPVVESPSIGEQTAQRLEQVGIRTVADLLQADPESTAVELQLRRVTREIIADWQRQARLVCCIPELRAYGAQILVGCGMTDPQQIARANVDELYRKVEAFCRTKQGQRVLRDGKPPSRSKVGEWVTHAASMRPLEAA